MSKNHHLLTKIFLTAYVVSLLPSPAIAQSITVFTDVNSDTNYVEAISYLKDNHLIDGYDDGSYGPSTTINRAEFAKILVGAVSNSPIIGKNCFPDVREDWYAPYVCTAKTLGLIDGYPDGNFKPADPVNFSEAAKMVANAFHLNKGEKDPALWFKEYIEALQNAKAIPLSVDYFDEKVTRDELAEIIWRIKADIKDKSSRTYLELQGDGLVQVDSCADLEARFKDTQRNYGGPIIYDDLMIPFPEGVRETSTGAPEPTTAPASSSQDKAAPNYGSAGSSTDYSHTNLQVEGVDEADIIKNDGKYIYLIKDNTVRIILAYPADQMKEIMNFQLGPQGQNFYPTEMYVDGDKLVVLGTAYLNYPLPLIEPATTTSPDGTTTNVDAKIAMPIRYNSSQSKVYIVDIADRGNPKVIRTVDFDGSYQTSRRIGDNLYVIMNQYPNFPYYYRVNQPIDNFSAYLPKMSDSANASQVEEVAPCNQYHIMPKPRSFNFMIAAAIPLNDTTKKVTREVVVGNSDNAYASTSNLYVASTDWSGPYLFSQGSFTKLYRFSLANGKISFSAEGLVPGTILNQFSMDEYLNTFRIATTGNQSVGSSSYLASNLFVMDSGLKTIGKIENIAPDEKLYAVRFMGQRAYLVSFKTVDPLMVVDLKDPTNPKILGELKIPGYSDYLHPYDDTHIIGFGKDVDPAEAAKDQNFVYYTAVKGFKMGLFDVSDPANPQEVAHEIIGDQGTYSELLNNHKALLFDQEKNLLAFPITVTQYPADEPICSDFTYSSCPSSCKAVCVPKCTFQNGLTICDQTCEGSNSCQSTSYVYPKPVFSGAYVYGVDLKKGFTLKGKITHLNSDEVADMLKNGYSDYQKAIRRILYIGDNLYTVSQGKVLANSLTNALAELSAIDLAGTIYNVTYGKGAEPVSS